MEGEKIIHVLDEETTDNINNDLVAKLRNEYPSEGNNNEVESAEEWYMKLYSNQINNLIKVIDAK